MAHQISYARDPGNNCKNRANEDGHCQESRIIQFGILSICLNECTKRENNLSYGILRPCCKKIFVGANLVEKNEQQEKSTAYIMIGSMRVLL